MEDRHSGIIPTHQLQLFRDKKLGKGGFGVVYEGQYRGKKVAVKELLVESLENKARQEFERETEIMRTLHDPSVLHLYGITVEPYRMVLEYCKLGSLDRYLQDRDRETVSWALRHHLASGIASGLMYLHHVAPPIVHGDLKSPNILLTGDPQEPDPKLADFGLSRVKIDTKSKTKSNNPHAEAMSLLWSAPEILALKPKTTAGDMYAYGMVLWEIASHELPLFGHKFSDYLASG